MKSELLDGACRTVQYGFKLTGFHRSGPKVGTLVNWNLSLSDFAQVSRFGTPKKAWLTLQIRGSVLKSTTSLFLFRFHQLAIHALEVHGITLQRNAVNRFQFRSETWPISFYQKSNSPWLKVQQPRPIIHVEWSRWKLWRTFDIYPSTFQPRCKQFPKSSTGTSGSLIRGCGLAPHL